MADFKLKEVRLSFPNIWKAKEFQAGDGKFRYDATFLVEPGSANAKAIDNAILAACTEKGMNAEKAAKFRKSVEGNSNKMAYQDGDLKDYDGYQGMMYLACHSKVRPLIIDRNREQLVEEDGKPYAGCFVNATVSIYAITEGKFPGIFAGFSGIQFVRDGDAFGGGSAAKAEDFDDLGETSDDDLV